MPKTAVSHWGVIPGDAEEIDNVRARCRGMVRRRAALAAGVSSVPVPGLDVVSDLSLFKKLVEDVNHAFGLTPDQIDRLQPSYRLIAYQAAVGIGGMLVGKLVTRELVVVLFKRMGIRMVAKSAARVVPFAGQIASAAIGFAVFRKLGYEHVEACAAVARQVTKVVPAQAGT